MLTHGAVNIVYEGDGNRVSETVGGTTTKYLVDRVNPTHLPQVLDEIVSGSVTRTYAYGLNRISENQLISGTWTPSFYGYDGHGNVRSLTNSAGAITDSYDFDAFGMPIRTSGTTPNQFLYNGQRSDSSIGLYDLRARYYSQATGRFWARDFLEGVKCCGLSWNPYIYTKDNPVNRIDPSGLDDLVEEVNIQNLSENAAQAARRLRVPIKLFKDAIHALKSDCGGQFAGNPNVLIDITNGNAYLPAGDAFEFLGCVLDYIVDEW